MSRVPSHRVLCRLLGRGELTVEPEVEVAGSSNEKPTSTERNEITMLLCDTRIPNMELPRIRGNNADIKRQSIYPQLEAAGMITPLVEGVNPSWTIHVDDVDVWIVKRLATGLPDESVPSDERRAYVLDALSQIDALVLACCATDWGPGTRGDVKKLLVAAFAAIGDVIGELLERWDGLNSGDTDTDSPADPWLCADLVRFLRGEIKAPAVLARIPSLEVDPPVAEVGAPHDDGALSPAPASQNRTAARGAFLMAGGGDDRQVPAVVVGRSILPVQDGRWPDGASTSSQICLSPDGSLALIASDTGLCFAQLDADGSEYERWREQFRLDGGTPTRLLAVAERGPTGLRGLVSTDDETWLVEWDAADDHPSLRMITDRPTQSGCFVDAGWILVGTDGAVITSPPELAERFPGPVTSVHTATRGDRRGGRAAVVFGLVVRGTGPDDQQRLVVLDGELHEIGRTGEAPGGVEVGVAPALPWVASPAFVWVNQEGVVETMALDSLVAS